ncbi:MAG: DUF4358 domain-containing protein [Eubacterium sp.]|nr:DUF4358 domain-containing protein [Eubacterium sp.]
MKKVLSLVIVATLVFGAFGLTSAKASTTSGFNAVRSTYGKYFPTESKIARKNFFGKYNKILGLVSTKGLKSYKVAQKFTGKSKKTQRLCVIVQAKKRSQVKGIKSKFRKYISNEKGAYSRGYYSRTGKSLLDKASVGSKGNYVYLFILDTSGNGKAKSAFKRAA